jgi:hypothetical protein
MQKKKNSPGKSYAQKNIFTRQKLCKKNIYSPSKSYAKNKILTRIKLGKKYTYQAKVIFKKK